jgi:hypothetical protein
MKRPTCVTTLAVLSFLSAGIIILLSPLVLARGAALTNLAAGADATATLARFGIGATAVFLAIAAIYTAVGVGLLLLMNWARLLLITLVILGAIAAVVGIVSSFSPFQGEIVLGRSLGLLINVGILFYLFDRSVKEAFTKPSAA